MQLIINLIIITLSITYIWNYSGFIFDITKLIYQKLNPNSKYMGQQLPKPIGCSMCMVFWTTFIISLLSVTLIYSLGIATLFTILSVFIDKLYGVLFRLINKIK